MPIMRLTNKDDCAALAAFCGDTLCGTYILCRYLCYGNRYPFARCFVDRVGDSVRTAVSVMENTAVLLAGDETDYESLALFLPLLGVATVMTDEKTAQHLPFSAVQQRTALRLQREVLSAVTVDEAPTKDIYTLISEVIPGSFLQDGEAYLHFLSDYTFRHNRGRARLKAVMDARRLCACALTAAESDSAAVISGVACRSDCRGKGYGRTVVNGICRELQQEKKAVHVIALNDSAVGFYRKLGFIENEQMVWLKIE